MRVGRQFVREEECDWEMAAVDSKQVYNERTKLVRDERASRQRVEVNRYKLVIITPQRVILDVDVAFTRR